MSKSDHTKPQINIFDLLPEVYKSDVNRTLYETTFNRLLTKDDTTRVAGYVGESTSTALTNRQIQEPTPHRQAYQLQPIMHTKVGDVDYTLTQNNFLSQLELLGVDKSRLPLWANAVKFNWIPPVNIDMLVNYTNYYWKAETTQDPLQYFTIENRCNKARSKVSSYQNVLTQRGESHLIKQVSPSNNTFSIENDLSDLFVEGFTFFTKDTANVNYTNKFWEVISSTYDSTTNETTIVVDSNIAIRQETAPVTTQVGRWWYKPSTNQLFRWNGTAWVISPAVADGNISLQELLSVYQREANCVCNEAFGWDLAPWDDNQIGPVLWDTALLAAISHNTETQWITANGPPAPFELWYDLINDQLLQRNAANTAFIPVVNSFSVILTTVAGVSPWDQTLGCVTQELNQWSEQNHWIHKTEVTTFAGVKRAQIPILEFNSTVELNSWIKTNYVWKNRAEDSDEFEPTTNTPQRFELEPIKGYVARVVSGVWYIYLFDKFSTSTRDIDYSTTFVPDYQFRVVDDSGISQVYTVDAVEYRETTVAAGDNFDTLANGYPAPVGRLLSNYFVTVVRIQEPVFSSPLVGGGVLNTRIEPIKTSFNTTWRGYHLHWVLDVDNITTVPASSQPWNYKLSESLSQPTVSTVLPNMVQRVGVAHQESSITAVGVSTINIDPSLLFDVTTSQHFALSTQEDFRVYVNGIRQYGTYTLTTSVLTPNYTIVGTDVYNNIPITCISSVVFITPLAQFDVVRIELSTAAFTDQGMFNVPVRTTEDETAFAAELLTGAQPVYRSLSVYQRNEQIKTKPNQYPLFNVYDVCTGDVIDASPLFAFKEDSSFPVDVNTNTRIVTSDNGRSYTFIQYLLDRDNNLLYGYHNLDLLPTQSFWYSPAYNTVKQWDGKAWTSNIIVKLVNNVVVRHPVISSSEPTELSLIDGSIWFNPSNHTVYKRDVLSNSWVIFSDAFVGDADPLLQTIWKHGPNNDEVVPQYVDKNRSPVTVGSPLGDWQILEQWEFNPEHHNRAEISMSELITHLSSVVSAQRDIPGLLNGGVYTLPQNSFNYGIGGTIHEYNDSFDTLISAINVTNTTPRGVMEFAREQYASLILMVRNTFSSLVASLYANINQANVLDRNQYTFSTVTNSLKTNDFLNQTYGDTTMFDSVTNAGMPNWIATLPKFKLSQKYRPHLNVDSSFVELFHHDGHRTQLTYSSAEKDRYSRLIIATPDTRIANGTFGKLSTLAPPATEASFIAAFSGTIPRIGVYWYSVSVNRKLYKFDVFTVGSTVPPFTIGTETLADGTLYYNTVTKTVFKKVGLVWVAITVPGSGDLTPCWKEIIFEQELGNVLLKVETLLYDACPATEQLAFDYSTLTSSISEQSVYDNLYHTQFLSYVAKHNVVAPHVNTTYVATNAFTYNYVNSVVNVPPRGTITPGPASSWQETYNRWYGTPYPHLEPWKLQGFPDKPTWWDVQYSNDDPLVYGNRRWKYIHATTTGMWENIRLGVVPAGRTYPSGKASTGNSIADGQTIPSYNYFSVNIADTTIAGGYVPDSLLPPYYDPVASPNPALIRSIYTALGSQVAAPEADYVFGSVGPAEWEWSVSYESVYDKPIIAFLMQPVRFFHYAFGTKFIAVDQLQVDSTFCQVYSHEDALFHSDVYDSNKIYSVDGINQWYVNFNRASGFDTNTDFRALWAGWKPRLSYLFGGIIDSSTFEIFNRYFDVVNQDFSILLTNSGVIDDLWNEGFEVSILSTPPSIIQYNNQSKWKLNFDSLASVDRSLPVYGTKSYPFTVDNVTNVCTMFKYNIAAANTSSQRFFIEGDYATIFDQGVQFTVSNSSGNDGIYTVESSFFDPGTATTRINVVEVVPSTSSGGIIDLSTFTMPWTTGDMVFISSAKNLPAPLVDDVPYFIVRLSSREFKLAETNSDALSNNTIDFVTTGTGDLRVSEVTSTFRVFNGTGRSEEVWYHYALDKNVVKTLTPPFTIVGMQTLIDIIDGYAEYQRDLGLSYNLSDANEFDIDSGRTITWQFEIERFINWAYNLRATNVQISDRYPIAVNSLSTNEFLFTTDIPSWATGSPVIITTTGILPAPLIANTPYYFVTTSTPGVFTLGFSSLTNVPSNVVDITSFGSGTLHVSLYQQRNSFPSLEINPARNNLWINTPRGILSNVVSGPYSDIRVNQTIFDQYGRALTADKFNVFREDTQTRIACRPTLTNDVTVVPSSLQDQYSFLHMGGGHFFVEGYEHALVFNDYTVGGNLLYDSFLGLHAKKFDVDYFEKQNFSLRPTLGGYYLVDDKFYRNVEGSATDVQHFYDTFELVESTEEARRARSLLGYTGRSTFLDLVNLNSKSQFLFYRGMIQQKGSVASVMAFINSRRFVDAKIDEFWALKLADFGDSRPRVYPEIKLFAKDAELDDVRLHFLSTSENITNPDVAAAIEDDGFFPVEISDSTRWKIHPEQRDEIVSSLFLDAEISSFFKVYVSTSAPTMGQTTVDCWYNPTTQQIRVWDGLVWNVSLTFPIKITTAGGNTYVKLDQPFDDIRVIHRQLTVPGDLREYSTQIYSAGTGINQVLKVNSEIIRFQTAGFSGVMMLFTINPGHSKINPSKLIDDKTGTVLFDVQYWDPARGNHYNVAYHNVDVDSNQDPAAYNVSLALDNITQVYWSDPEIGTVWFDTSQVGYVSYYDDILYPSTNDRLFNWGKLAPWANIKIYQWVSSSVPPIEWEGEGQVQASTLLIPQREKISGTPRQTLFKRSRAPVSVSVVGITSTTITAVPNPSVHVANNIAGKHEVQFSAAIGAGTATGYVGPAPFQSNVYVDGIQYLISVSSVSALTFGALVAEINNDLFGVATASIDTINNRLVITSNSTGLNSTVIIQDITLFSTLPTYSTVLPAIPGVSGPSYTGTIIVNGTSYNITIDSDVTSTPTSLATALNLTIGSVAMATPVGSNILITSLTPGSHSTLSVVGGTLFNSVFPVVVGTDGRIQTSTPFVVHTGDQILFTSSNTLPIPIVSGFKYVVTSLNSTGTEFQLVEAESETPVFITSPGVGTLSLVPAFLPSDWKQQSFNRVRFYAGTDFSASLPTVTNPTFIIPTVDWSVGDVVELYINDKLAASGLMVTQSGLNFVVNTTNISLSERDIIDIVRPLHTLTDDETDFDPDVEDTGTINIQWKYDYEYTQRQQFTDSAQIQTTYYFWVEDTLSRDISDSASLSTFEISQQLRNIPSPYFVTQYPKDDDLIVAKYGYGVSPVSPEFGASSDERYLTLPVLYRQAILRGAASFIRDDDRYIWRFTRDLSLRDSLKGGLQLKNKHQEWFLFRQEQPSTIPSSLWIRLVESLVGYKLDNPAIRVPALERELFDAANNTDTRYGLGPNQAFVNKEYALRSIIAYLEDNTNDFSPVNIDDFFTRNNFDTPAAIITAMNEIFTTFTTTHINRIWFETLHDAFSTRSKYKEIMKTSWVALHGIRVLEVGGLFDD